MATSVFLSIPVTIREKIYTELLAFPTKEGVPSSPLCNLLFLNRQCYLEVTRFLKAQLCVLVKTNDTSWAGKLLCASEKLPIVSQLLSEEPEFQPPVTSTVISMSVDLFSYDNHLKAKSFPVFLLPASAIQELQRILWSDFSMWGGLSMSITRMSISFNLSNTVSVSQKTMLERLLQPWLDYPISTSFLGVITNSAIPQVLSSQLKEKLTGDHAATGHLRKMQSLIRRDFLTAQTGDWAEAAAMSQMTLQYIWLIWDCSLECMLRETTAVLRIRVEGDFVVHLWEGTAIATANQVGVLIRLALKSEAPFPGPLVVPTNCGSREKLEEARELAEKTINLLRTQPTRRSQDISGEVDPKIGRCKSKLSSVAHLACKGLGDSAAAIGYLEEAKRYKPEERDKFDEKILALRSEKSCASAIKQALVVWEPESQ